MRYLRRWWTRPVAPAPPQWTLASFLIMGAGAVIAVVLRLPYGVTILTVLPGFLLFDNRRAAEARRLGLISRDQEPSWTWRDFFLATIPVFVLIACDALLLHTDDSTFGIFITIFLLGLVLCERRVWRRAGWKLRS